MSGCLRRCRQCLGAMQLKSFRPWVTLPRKREPVVRISGFRPYHPAFEASADFDMKRRFSAAVLPSSSRLLRSLDLGKCHLYARAFSSSLADVPSVNDGALKGLKVLDLTRVLAVSACSKMVPSKRLSDACTRDHFARSFLPNTGRMSSKLSNQAQATRHGHGRPRSRLQNGARRLCHSTSRL